MPAVLVAGDDPAIRDRQWPGVRTGFAAGAGDYLAKPFEPGELRARISARPEPSTA
jgi:CheY-like chemotaxis protein